MKEFDAWFEEFKKLLANVGIHVTRNNSYSWYETGLSPYDAFLLISKELQ